MSRFRSSSNDLAYGDIPQRWDRERFERFGRFGPTTYEDDYRFTERDGPGHREVAVAETREASRPGYRFEERDRFFEDDRRRSRPGPRRRTDKELFGDVDPRELAGMALQPYRPQKNITRDEIDISIERGPARPGLLRRQSSLDTFDRRPIPPYTPVPLPIRRRRDDWGSGRGRYYEDEDYREVEIQRERSVHRRRPPKSERDRSVKEETKITHYHHQEDSSSSSESLDEIEETKSVRSKAPTVKSSKTTTVKAPSTKAPSTKARSRAPSVHESYHETIIEENAGAMISPPSIHESVEESAFEESIREERKFKKGKTRMPKRLVRVEAIMDLGYPFDEEEDFFVLRIALEKEQIDEVIQISEQYKVGDKRRIYRFEEKIDETVSPPPAGEHEVIQRTEWINPPTVIGTRSHRAKSIRDDSPNMKSSISQRSPSRAPSAPPAPPPPQEFYEERKTIIEERSPSHYPAGTLVLAEREHRSDRDLHHEIRALENERRALRLEREAQERHDLALRVRDNGRDELVIYERERSPPRNVIRVEKDKKGRMALVRSAH